jgi:3',5'-cyclic-AMP phosphodiesterase
MDSITRRTALKTAGLATAGLALGGLPSWAMAMPRRMDRKRVLRIAHLTDLHIQPERKADAGVAACLRHVRSQAEKPDLILLGGDLVMDSFESDDARTKAQWDLFTKVLKDECSIPVEACLGNHDIWGINKTKSKTTGAEPGWGKKRAMDLLGLTAPYRSFDRAGWHIVVLDSVMPQGEAYIGQLDAAQWEWLIADLKGTKLPVLVLSHIPILTATQLLTPRNKQSKKREINDSLMMADASQFITAFSNNPHVKACISGHIHEIDRVDFQGVSYLCNGAVSGNWWKGRHKQCDEGYAMIDLFDDGSIESRYVTYGWKAEG